MKEFHVNEFEYMNNKLLLLVSEKGGGSQLLGNPSPCFGIGIASKISVVIHSLKSLLNSDDDKNLLIRITYFKQSLQGVLISDKT